jgi:hypothetical protein
VCTVGKTALRRSNTAAIEREFGRLKHDYGLAPLRVRGLRRSHADLTMLARLSQALSRAREAMPVAA